MNIRLAGSINSFGSKSPKVDIVSPQITVPATLLQDLLDTVQGLQDEVAQLHEARDQDREEIAALRHSVASLETTQEHDVNRICLDICQDRRRLAALETRPASGPGTSPPRGEKTVARIGKIDEILRSRGPTTLKQLEHILKISPKEMNRLLAKLDMRRYELHARPGDAREKVIRLKVQIR
jgi:hypothetical protein